MTNPSPDTSMEQQAKEAGLTNRQRFLLDWLSKDDTSAFGECRGDDLDELVRRGFAVVTPSRVGIDDGFRRVSLTDAGWNAHSEIVAAQKDSDLRKWEARSRQGAAMTSEINLRRALETIRDLPDAEIENGPEIAEAALDAIDHLNGLATSPDTSAAEVVGWRFRWLRQDGTPTASGEWHLAKERPPLLPSVANIEELVLKSTLDTSRAETAAAKRERDEYKHLYEEVCERHKGEELRAETAEAALAAANARAVALERDLRDALAVAEPWHKAYETQLARADGLADLLDSNVASLGKQLADEGRAREAAEAELAKAVEALRPLSAFAEHTDRVMVEYLRTEQPMAAASMTDTEIAALSRPDSDVILSTGDLRGPRVDISMGEARNARIALTEIEGESQ